MQNKFISSKIISIRVSLEMILPPITFLLEHIGRGLRLMHLHTKPYNRLRILLLYLHRIKVVDGCISRNRSPSCNGHRPTTQLLLQ